MLTPKLKHSFIVSFFIFGDYGHKMVSGYNFSEYGIIIAYNIRKLPGSDAVSSLGLDEFILVF